MVTPRKAGLEEFVRIFTYLSCLVRTISLRGKGGIKELLQGMAFLYHYSDNFAILEVETVF